MLQVTTQIGKIETQADGGNKITSYTPILKPEEMTELFRLKGDGECITIFQPIGRTAPKLDPNLGESKPKSKSQELRNTLYRYWEQEWSGTTKFDEFYNSEMDKINQHYISKLN